MASRRSDAHTAAYVREKRLGQMLGVPLKALKLDPENIDWTREALLSSHAEQSEFHKTTLRRLLEPLDKIDAYLNQAYQDRVEGRISIEFWQQRGDEWRRERADLRKEITAHENAQTSCLRAGVRLIDVAQVACDLYVSQKPAEQRRLLDTV